MLSEQEIKQALRASRVVAVGVANPHGPFGLEHLLRRLRDSSKRGIRRSSFRLELPADTWQKLEHLADEATQNASRPITVSDLAAAILHQYVSIER